MQNLLILQVLKAIQALGKHLILRDFNFYHTHQGKDRVKQYYAKAMQVVKSLCTRLVDLLLKLGTVTREKHKNKLFTLNLALSTLNLTPQVTSYKVVNTFTRSDYKLIKTLLNTSLVCTNLLLRRAFKKANVAAIAASAQQLQLLVHKLESA